MAVFVAPDYSGGAVPGFNRSSLFVAATLV
jgi:hypothetical protein